jgi:gliding motility-associated-like protein
VFVLPGPPVLPQPTIFNIDPTCNSYCDGSIFVSPNGGTGVQTISWNGPQQGFNPNGLCAGVYTLTLVDALGCNITTTVTLIDPPPLTINPITGQDTICINSVVNLYDISSVTPNLNYVWTTNSGTISTGQGSTQINIDATGVPSGFYNNMISVYGVDGNGCTSQTQNYNINIYNETPIITPVGPFCSYDEFLTLQATPINGVFSGNGVIGNDFYPSNAVGTSTITYTYTQSGCVFGTTTDITVYPQPILDSITPYNPFYEICEGDSVNTLFNVIADLPGYNVWSLLGVDYQTDIFNTTWDNEGIFTISVVHYTNGCVSNQQETVVVVENCPEELIYIPNTFTPDGNELNQVFLPVFTSGFDPYDYQLLIFNRWGNLIFESNDHKMGWDGTFNNAYAQDGTYSWIIRYGNVETDKKTEIRGFITIIK